MLNLETALAALDDIEDQCRHVLNVATHPEGRACAQMVLDIIAAWRDA